MPNNTSHTTDNLSPPVLGIHHSPEPSLADRFLKAIAIARDLFPGEVEIEDRVDPEVPDLRYVVVSVHAKGDLEEIVDRQCEWHRRLDEVSDPAMRAVRLSVYPSA